MDINYLIKKETLQLLAAARNITGIKEAMTPNSIIASLVTNKGWTVA